MHKAQARGRLSRIHPVPELLRVNCLESLVQSRWYVRSGMVASGRRGARPGTAAMDLPGPDPCPVATTVQANRLLLEMASTPQSWRRQEPRTQ